jgi:hypothetical protein
MHRLLAVTRTLQLLLLVLIAFKLGAMSVSFTGSQWAWGALVAFIVALPSLSFELLRAIWSGLKPIGPQK